MVLDGDEADDDDCDISACGCRMYATPVLFMLVRRNDLAREMSESLFRVSRASLIYMFVGSFEETKSGRSSPLFQIIGDINQELLLHFLECRGVKDLLHG